MSKDISASLARVRNSASKLNELCDQAAESVRILEEYLAKECSVGIEASVTVNSECDEHYQHSMSLSYRRWGNRFRVLIEWYYSDYPPPDDVEAKPWAECKREEKLEALPYLFDLISAIEKNVESKIEKAESAISGIAKLTAPARNREATNAKK